MKVRSVLIGVVTALVISASGASAQTRPGYCTLLDTMGSQEASDALVSQSIQDTGYSPYRGEGARVMERSRRMVGWLFYMYAQGYETWTSYTLARVALQDYVLGIINEYGGEVPGLVREELPIFDEFAYACGTVRA